MNEYLLYPYPTLAMNLRWLANLASSSRVKKGTGPDLVASGLTCPVSLFLRVASGNPNSLAVFLMEHFISLTFW